MKLMKKKKRNITDSISKTLSNVKEHDTMIEYTEDKLRGETKKVLESFEHWSRRIINEKFTEKYGIEYFDYVKENGEGLIKREILKTITDRMTDNPGRFPRKIDAILMEDIEYFLCKDEFYNYFFKSIIENFFSGQVEVRRLLKTFSIIWFALSVRGMKRYSESFSFFRCSTIRTPALLKFSPSKTSTFSSIL